MCIFSLPVAQCKVVCHINYEFSLSTTFCKSRFATFYLQFHNRFRSTDLQMHLFAQRYATQNWSQCSNNHSNEDLIRHFANLIRVDHLSLASMINSAHQYAIIETYIAVVLHTFIGLFVNSVESMN